VQLHRTDEKMRLAKPRAWLPYFEFAFFPKYASRKCITSKIVTAHLSSRIHHVRNYSTDFGEIRRLGMWRHTRIPHT